MGDWSSYTLSDFLLFSPRVYERLFVLHNQDWWPAHLLSLALGTAVLVLVLRASQSSRRTAFLILGVAWIFVAVAFFLGRYQTINWLGAYIAPAAGLQGLALILFSLSERTALVSTQQNRFVFAVGFTVLTAGLLIYPLIELAFGTDFEGVQVFGLTADPTAVATLGAIALLNTRARHVLALIPALWCVFTALTLSTLERQDVFLAPVFLTIALTAIAWHRPAAENRIQS